jgi:hypothetical protein
MPSLAVPLFVAYRLAVISVVIPADSKTSLACGQYDHLYWFDGKVQKASAENAGFFQECWKPCTGSADFQCSRFPQFPLKTSGNSGGSGGIWGG